MDRDTEAYVREQAGLPPQMEIEDLDPADQALRNPQPPLPDEDALDEEPDETEPEEPEKAPAKVKKRWRRAA